MNEFIQVNRNLRGNVENVREPGYSTKKMPKTLGPYKNTAFTQWFRELVEDRRSNGAGVFKTDEEMAAEIKISKASFANFKNAQSVPGKPELMEKIAKWAKVDDSIVWNLVKKSQQQLSKKVEAVSS